MLLTPELNITIGSYTFTRCNALKIERCIREVASIAKIKVPVSAALKDKSGKMTAIELPKAIKRGNAVTIELYYKEYPKYKTTYTGWVKRISHAYPCVIECEDLFPLREVQVQKSWESVTVKEVLSYLLSGSGISADSSNTDITLSPYTIKKGDAAFALQKLAEDTGMCAYRQADGSLYFGLAYAPVNGTVKYVLTGDETNVADATGLKYHLASETTAKIKAVNINGDNSRTEVTVGDDDGPERTLHFYNIASESELKERATEELQKFKFDGYEGDLKTLLIPKVDIGYTAVISDPKFERTGSYFVEKVTTELSDSGAKRTVEISIKLDE